MTGDQILTAIINLIMGIMAEIMPLLVQGIFDIFAQMLSGQ